MPSHDRYRRRRGRIFWRLALLGAALATLAHLATAGASFVGTTTNGPNTISASSGFPSFAGVVGADGPWAYHRLEDAPSSAATSTAADSSANSRPGTYGGPTNGPSTRWDLTEGSGTTATDLSGGANQGTLGSADTWTTGHDGAPAVAFTGDTSGNNYVSGTAPGVNTASAFTVAAWVYLTSTAASRVAVSQSGSVESGFLLRYNQSGNQWEFAVSQGPGESASPTFDSSFSAAGAPAVNTWTHLAGVYDGAGHVTLYVNGTAQTAGAHTALWNASGPLEVGRVNEFGAWQTGSQAGWAPWIGSIGQVRTYRRALSGTEITTLYNDDLTLAYDFNENGTGTTLATTQLQDGSGGRNTAVAGSTMNWSSSGHTGNALTFSVDANAYVTSTSSPVNTSRAFSVSAWVYLNTQSPTTVTRTVLSQQGTTYSTFILKYESTGHWAFMVAQNSTGTYDQVTSSVSATFNAWTHLAAVYNPSASAGQQLKLYVNNGTPDVIGHSTVYGVANPLQIGRTMWSGSWVDSFDGRIDEVRTFRKALSASEVTNLYNSGVVTTAPMSAGMSGALQGAQQGQQSTTAVAFNGVLNAYNATQVVSPGPAAFTVECWFRAAGSSGGVLIGFGSSPTGTSASYDRMVYLDGGNQLTFGTGSSGAPKTVRSPGTYADGNWHYLAASLGAAGLRLYVDGNRVASDATTTTAASYTGYWRWGGDTVAGSWPNQPASDNFIGTIDEVAIYGSQLSDQQIAWHYAANH